MRLQKLKIILVPVKTPTMNVERIEKLENILSLDENKTIIDHQVKRLTAPGENFGSLMLSVDITVQNVYGTEEIHTVAKMVPPNDFIQEVFNTQTTSFSFFSQVYRIMSWINITTI